MRLTLIIPSLGRGGAERTASMLANAWAAEGNAITLVTLEKNGKQAYSLHSAVTLRQLGVWGPPVGNIFSRLLRQIKNIRALRGAIRESRADLVISFMDVPNVIMLLATRGLRVATVVTEHVHPDYHRIAGIWQILRRLTYPRADALACVSEPVMQWFQERITVNARVIPNPVDVPAFPVHYNRQEHAGHVIAGMGRLVPQKGFDLLIDAFSRVAERYPDWTLKVMGEGPRLDDLRRQAEKLRIADRVELAGAVADPFPVLRAADLFVFPSRFEGFGNALCEAMACGLPVISFDCPSGPSEIIRDGVDGILVPAENVARLSEAMARLMNDAGERERLAARAPEVLQRFGLERVLGLWKDLFVSLTSETSRAQAKASTEIH